jgi:colicin import membrane protein
MVGEDNWENVTKDMEEMQKNVNEEELKKSSEKAKENITEEDAKKMLEDQKSRAKSAAERIQKENKELADIDKELEELNKDKENNKDKIKELQDKKVDLIKKSTLGKASPSAAKASIDKVGKEEGEGKTEPKPEDKTGDDGKGKKETETEKEETEEGKYIVKDEEVTDPETGEKKKVKTYTGPRGGKFYYPDGKPKTPENKVYVTDSKQYTSLRNYLFEKLY